MRRVAMAATMLLSLSAVGCGGSPAAPGPPATPARDSVNSLTNLNPATGTTLHPGQTVTFTGTAGYTLASADLGAIVMVIQDQADRPLPISGSQQTILAHRGTSDATLSQTVTLPSEGVTSVRVFFMLAPAGTTTTNAVLSVAYLVR